MKTTIKKMLAVLLLFTVLTSISAYTTVTKAESLYSAQGGSDGAGGVWNTQVITYLEGFNYSGIIITDIWENGHRICIAYDLFGMVVSLHVLVEGGAIVGHEEWGG